MSFFSTTLKVPISILQEKADKLTSLAEDNEAIFDTIYATLRCMEGSGEWLGLSLTAAVNATENNRKKFAQTVDEMKILAEFLKSFADEMAAADEEIKNNIHSI